MKTTRDIRPYDTDGLRKARRLEPIRKSGKERHALYGRFDQEDEEMQPRAKRESAFDYFDDEE